MEGADLISASQTIYLPSDILRGLGIVTKIFLMQNEMQPLVEPLLSAQPFPLDGQDQWVELCWGGRATKYLLVRYIWHTKTAMSKGLALCHWRRLRHHGVTPGSPGSNF